MSEKVGLAIPDPREAECFRFLACDYDSATGIARLSYAFDGGPELVERVTFPHAPWPPEASRQASFRRALEILHLVAGISYYKAGLSKCFQFQDPQSIGGVSAFLSELYVKGLAELGYVNRVDIKGRVNFPADGEQAGEGRASARPLILPERALVAMGGGKDSLVGLDRLQKAGIEVMPVCVGHSVLIGDTVKAAGLPLIRIGRVLAPELAEMNQAGAWNGHIPVTAVNSAILLCAAILYGFRYVVFSNERSADEATLVTKAGVEVNHQYSKSSAFEASFRSVIASQVSPDIEYFSVLRQHSELGIVRRFSSMKKFHPVYSSCNRNFHLEGPRVENRWCLDCPKCRFAALSLAMFLSPEEVIAIQGRDLLDDPAQEDGFRALCQLGREKPFECVGEAGESRAALAALGASREWGEHAVVRALFPELDQLDVPDPDTLLRPWGRHFIPTHLLRRMNVADAVTGRVAILGIGREGQAAWRFLRSLYPEMPMTLVAESAPAPEFREQLSDKDRVIIGPLSEAGLDEFDTLVRSPGISPYRTSLRRAREAGAAITSPSNLWFASHPDQKTICITGTKGKSTTSAMLAHMLASCGLRVRLAGNIGLPLLDCNDRDVDWWVVELSSYQLADLEANPTLAVMLNLSSEHLDWHDGEQNYRADKLRLARLSGRQPLVANAADPVLAKTLCGYSNVVWFNTAGGFRVDQARLYDGETALQPEVPEGLPGAHNLSNIAAALTVLRLIGAEVSDGVRSIASFRSLPHRLQVVGEKSGVRFINDSISSTPLATVAALEAYAGQKITLLLGGLDRGLDWAPYIARIKLMPPDAIIGMPDNGPRIIREMRAAGVNPIKGIHEAADLETAVELAGKLALPGSVVLLSPGAPSFPRYNDYRDRGRRFALLCGFEFDEQEIFASG
jgi:UDP-N-acetylmuramoylalanine--D-glutamate ligase